jgi:hypothetical protein
MAYTEVTRQSWFSRIGGAFKGIIVGVILIIAAFPVLFTNEGRAVRRHKTLQEGAGLAISIESETVNEENNGKLVHVSGKATTDELLTDSVFDVSVNAIHLKRDVEMYQWRENVETDTKVKTGGARETTKTYTYSKVWSSTLIDSSTFVDQKAGNVNPGAMPYESNRWSASLVTLGAFRLPEVLINRISNYSKVDIPPGSIVPETLGERAKIHDSGYYIGVNPLSPEIGDTRVMFSAVTPTEISVIARQNGNTFETFTTPKTGGRILELMVGIHSKDEMFASAVSANRVMTWILRLVGFILFLVGFNLVFHPFKVVADVLPFMGKIVGAGMGMIAFLLSAMLSLLVISIAWIVYRPLLGIPLLIIAVALIVLIIKKIKDAKAPAPATTPAQ